MKTEMKERPIRQDRQPDRHTPLIILPRNILPPPHKHTRSYNGPGAVTMILSILALLALIHFITSMHTTSPGTTSSDCSGLIHNADYTKFVQLLPALQEMDAIQFTNELTGDQPSALVQVVDNSSQHRLDVYLYGCSMQHQKPQLSLLFKQQGLVQGTAAITEANTLSIGLLDSTLPPDASITLQPLQQYIYREYSWHDGGFLQVEFPGLYPVTSRTQAEALQEQANNGQALLWKSPLDTAIQMAKDLLYPSANTAAAQLLDQTDTTAHVALTQEHTQIIVTLSQLIQHNSSGLWFVTGAQTSGITLARSRLLTSTASPVTVQGNVIHHDPTSQIKATLFDHTLTPLPILNTVAVTIKANGTYSDTLFYTNDAANQPGLLLIEQTPANSDEPEQLLLTALILG